jgi:hypothetical protein
MFVITMTSSFISFEALELKSGLFIAGGATAMISLAVVDIMRRMSKT